MSIDHPSKTCGIGRVAMGMSGGVDSSVAALLLLRQGYEVTGITMMTRPDGAAGPCAGTPSRDGGEPASSRAARICSDLGIPHVAIDLSTEFEKRVLAPLREGYAAGMTPNPCVLCNRWVKFEALLSAAEAMGRSFDAFSTGHYARLGRVDGRIQLLKAGDRGKDQSYFLAMLTQQQLGMIMLPLGDLSKDEVRRIAVENGWSALASDPESQDFAGGGLPEVLGAGCLRPGPIISSDGSILGRHRGTAFYTIGQRKGLGIGGRHEPLYVMDVDAVKNTVTLGTRPDLLSSSLVARHMNWIAIEAPSGTFRAEAKIRSRHVPAAASVTVADGGDSVEVAFDEPQSAITPGQLLVLHDGDFLLGAGWIAKPGSPA
jgi:tRNA-specific 2-thiouridylase